MPELIPPAHLVNAERAHAARDEWEATVRQTFEAAADEYGVSLTAGGPPWWQRLTRRVQDLLPSLPGFARTTLDLSGPEDVDELIRHLATASYNRSVLQQLIEYGYRKKAWAARLDGRTRMAHGNVHGNVCKISQPFVVGGYLMQYPGDQNTAPIEMWARCRCVVIAG